MFSGVEARFAMNEGFIMNKTSFSPLPASLHFQIFSYHVLMVGMLFVQLPIWAQAPAPLNQSVIEPYYLFPASSEAALVSFDWDSSGTLHYTVGDPNYGLKLEVYKFVGNTPVPVYQTTSAWPGSLLTCIGNHVYFNDGGDYARGDFNYFVYDAASPEIILPLLEAPYGASLWGITGRGQDEFFASGSIATWGPAALFYSRLNGSGLLESVPPVVFGEVGDSPGPMAFDPFGNLYYVPGYAYSGTATIYRWNAQEVEAAVTGGGTDLQPTGREWAALPAPYDGATGMIADPYGNIYVTATSWGAPSQLIVFKSEEASSIIAAEYEGRLETLRYRENGIYVSCADGIFRMPLLQVATSLEDETVEATLGDTVIFSVEASGGIGGKKYQWYRVDAQKTALSVGVNLPHYSLTARTEDSGAHFYCTVSDAVYSVESPHFLLTVQEPVPMATFPIVLFFVSLLLLLGILALIPGKVITSKLKISK